MKDLDDDPEKVPQEELVAAGDRCDKIAKGECRGVFLGVWKLVQACHKDANHVECEGERKVLDKKRV